MQNIVENSSFDDLNKRGSNLLKTGTYSDCSFSVGTDDNKRNIAGHKQILAMGSPVFERMLYGDLASNDDGSPIEITDIQPDAFMGMLEYIYAHQITIENFDRACSLCYLADKYMLPSLFESCVDFIMKNLKASTACRAYELAKLLNKPKLLARSLEIINKETSDVLNDPSFIDIEPSTLMDILNEDSLNITELELFNALVKYANAATDSGDASKLALFTILPFSVKDEPADEETLIRQAVKKICFLTITAQEFVDVVACSNILTQTEAYLILSKIVSPKNTKISMPEGFATEMKDRKNRPRRCCTYHRAYSCVLANCSR